MHFIVRFVLVTCLTGLLAACGQPDSEPEAAPPETDARPTEKPAAELAAESPPVADAAVPEDDTGLADTSWVATEINGQATAEGVESTLAFEGEEKVTGTGGCNRYFGPATVTGERLQFGNLATTMMACPEHMSAQETRFLGAMSQVLTWSREGDSLSMADEGGNTVIRFARVPDEPPPLDLPAELPETDPVTGGPDG